MVLCCLCCRPSSLFCGRRRTVLKEAVLSSQRVCPTVCTAGGACLGAVCPFVQPRLAGGSALQRTSFRVVMENVTASPACLLHAKVEEREGKHPEKGDLCGLPSAALGSGQEDAICYHLAGLGHESTEHSIVLDLGGRSWQCACWAAVFSKP